jgi:hypothetical protein
MTWYNPPFIKPFVRRPATSPAPTTYYANEADLPAPLPSIEEIDAAAEVLSEEKAMGSLQSARTSSYTGKFRV